MPTLRSLIDSQIIVSNNKPKPAALKLNDQVVVQRTVNRGAQRTKEVMAGTIVAMSDDGKRATVTLPRAGGRILRTTMPIDKLKPASAIFGRARVQTNPAFRQIVK